LRQNAREKLGLKSGILRPKAVKLEGSETMVDGRIFRKSQKLKWTLLVLTRILMYLWLP
jgi:hypothetical protein